MRISTKMLGSLAACLLAGTTLVGCFSSPKSSPSPQSSPQQTNTPDQTPPSSNGQQTTDASQTNPGSGAPQTNDTQQNTQQQSGNLQAPLQKVTFPSPVQQAMQQFAQNPPAPLLAPTVIPEPTSSSAALSMRTWGNHEGTSYNVQFLETTTPYPINQVNMGNARILGGFSGTSYASADAAQNSFGMSGYWDVSNPWKYGSAGKLDSGLLDLGNGVMGHFYKFISDRPSAKSINRYASIVWDEGKWNLEVTSTESVDVPVSTAKEIVAYLHTYFLPVPDTKGAVVVNINSFQDGADYDTLVTWQKGNVIYQTQNFAKSESGALSAVRMAVSMYPY